MKNKWLITGVSGFIGSHLLESLLLQGHTVVGLDNFHSGKQENLDAVKSKVGESCYQENFTFVEGSVLSFDDCVAACQGVDYILHQAALVSVPLSYTVPQEMHAVNVTGTLNVFEAARRSEVKCVVYASSSAVYGNQVNLPIAEDSVKKSESLYGLTKRECELIADIYYKQFGLISVGLRYFNVYGPRQDVNSPYSGVITKWLNTFKQGNAPVVFGDGLATRDFVYVKDVVEANMYAAKADLNRPALINVGTGVQTTLIDLLDVMTKHYFSYALGKKILPIHEPERPGDIQHSCADMTKTFSVIRFAPSVSLDTGLANLCEDFVNENRKHTS